jgi:hypothetical protein
VALATDVHSAHFVGVHLRLRGDRPMRVSVQVRTSAGLRWGRSFYIAPEGSDITARLADLRAVGAAGAVPSSVDISSLLLVIDTINAAAGHAGHLVVLASDLVK